MKVKELIKELSNYDGKLDVKLKQPIPKVFSHSMNNAGRTTINNYIKKYVPKI